MSNQKKKNFQIEAFKHRVVMDPKYADKTWKILEDAIHEIYNHNASGLSFEELYRFGSSFFFDFFFLIFFMIMICFLVLIHFFIDLLYLMCDFNFFCCKN